jgi:3-deoxy-D-manno-octulosonic-acid transferase
MKSTVLHLLYNFLLILAFPGVLLRLLWRSRLNAGYAQRINERFGFYKQPYRTCGVVIHAVSVGETVAAQPLIERYLQAYPDLPITVTSTTPTGSARVKALFGDRVQHVYLPYDYCFALKRFFKVFKPKQLIIMETEWWPNLFEQAHQAEIKLFLANGRLSERSLKKYLRIPSLSRRMALCIDKICAQTQSDATHFIELGVSADKVEVTGNIKFDMKVSPSIHERALELKSSFQDRPVWIAASTHAGEEALITQTIKTVLAKFPDALCIVVPRHPERFPAFFQDLQSADFRIARRSLNESVQANTQIYFGDTMGELLLLYGAAQVAFVGGSFVPAGGHNMLEASLMNCAIIMGPHLENVSEQTAELVQTKGMLVVKSSEEFSTAIIDLLNSSQERSRLIAQACTFMLANQGAVDRTFISLQGAPK